MPLPGRPLVVENWTVPEGQTIALIGPNGVGKTTLSEAVLGLRAGARVDGRMLGVPLQQWSRRSALRTQLGVQLQSVFFPGRPRIGELVALHRRIYPRTSRHVLELLGVDQLMNRPYERLSRGETQRVDLFLALAHEPRIVFLDEPFTGLDPGYARAMGSLLSGRAGATTIMCCHTAEELALTTHVAWLHRGGIVRHGQTEPLRRELVGDYRLVATCRDPRSAAEVAERLRTSAAHERLPDVDGVNVSLCGSRPFTVLAQAMADWDGVESLDIGRSRYTDLLRHCARSIP